MRGSPPKGMTQARSLFALLVAALGLAAWLLLAPVAVAAAPEAPLTDAATGVTAAGATLHGELNPGGSTQATGYEFSYNTNGTCAEGFTTEPGEEGKEVAQAKRLIETTLTGLEPNREYTFCTVARHAEPEEVLLQTPAVGSQSFTTEAIPPVIESEAASVLSPFEARLEGVVNPDNEAVTCTFEYGATTSYGKAVACEPPPAGFGGQGIGATLSLLESGSTYHYRVLLENAAHAKTEGADQEFTMLTAEAPLIEGELFRKVTDDSAMLEAQVNPNYQSTTYAFEYGTEESLAGATTVPGAEPLAAGFGNQPISTELTGLTPRTQYFYRVSATNATGTSHGPTEPTETFTTLGAPLVTTNAPQAVTRTSVALSGTVNPGGVPTSFQVAFVEAAAYEEGKPNPYANGKATGSAIVVQSPGASEPVTDFTAHPVNAFLGELKPATTYDYAVLASNEEGTTFGPNQQLTTPGAIPPTAATGPASAVTANSATISGTADTRELPGTIEFEFGSTPGAGFILPATAVPGSESGSSIGVSTSLLGVLLPSSTYYYRLIVANSDGTAYGAIQSFTTAAVPGAPLIAPVPLISWPAYVGKELTAAEHAANPGTSTSNKPKPLTKKQKLAKALKACTKKAKRKRAACRRQAERKYR